MIAVSGGHFPNDSERGALSGRSGPAGVAGGAVLHMPLQAGPCSRSGKKKHSVPIFSVRCAGC